jgi:hypothetical protein
MKDILILDDSLSIRIFYDRNDCDYEDNICVSIREDCPEEEKLFKADETNIFLTPDQARALAMALIDAVNGSLGLG